MSADLDRNEFDVSHFPSKYKDETGQKCHESLLRSYHILSRVMVMIDRKDSPETIDSIVALMQGQESKP